MTLEELRELQGSPAPIRKFVWYQEYLHPDGHERKYLNITPCDSDTDVLRVELRKGFHHWLCSEEMDAPDAYWQHRQGTQP